MIYHRAVNSLLTVCLTPGDNPKTHLLCFREEFFQVLKFFIAEAWV